jgi:hypothetical protein
MRDLSVGPMRILRPGFLRLLLVLCLADGAAADRLGAQEASGGSGGTAGAGLWQPAPGESQPAGVPEPERIARLRAQAQAKGRPEDWLAFGAALLHTGDWQGAVPPLREALDSRDPELREDAVYDLALAWALAGSPGTAAGAPSGASSAPEAGELDDPGTPRDRLLRARDGFRAVLRADPASEDARWNLELVERWLENEAGGDSSEEGEGGGEGSGGQTQGGGEGGAPMTPEEAQRLLEAAAGQEREVQARRLERNRDRDPSLEKNW